MSNAIIERFSLFSGTEGGIESWLTPDTDPRIFRRLLEIDSHPLSRSQLNQLLLLGHEAALSEGFFRYYWLYVPPPHEHPYNVEASDGYSAEYNGLHSIHSLEHLRWGLYRFYTDALSFFGNVRQAYRQLRGRTFTDIANFYTSKCHEYDTSGGLFNRGLAPVLSPK